MSGEAEGPTVNTGVCVCVCGPQRVLPPGSSCNPSSSAARFEAAETLLCPPTQGERILFPYTAQM